eukprot:4494579-Pleurochrysis_carterae.AAC.4
MAGTRTSSPNSGPGRWLQPCMRKHCVARKRRCSKFQCFFLGLVYTAWRSLTRPRYQYAAAAALPGKTVLWHARLLPVFMHLQPCMPKYSIYNSTARGYRASNRPERGKNGQLLYDTTNHGQGAGAGAGAGRTYVDGSGLGAWSGSVGHARVVIKNFESGARSAPQRAAMISDLRFAVDHLNAYIYATCVRQWKATREEALTATDTLAAALASSVGKITRHFGAHTLFRSSAQRVCSNFCGGSMCGLLESRLDQIGEHTDPEPATERRHIAEAQVAAVRVLHDAEHRGEREYADSFGCRGQTYPKQCTALNIDAPTQHHTI